MTQAEEQDAFSLRRLSWATLWLSIVEGVFGLIVPLVVLTTVLGFDRAFGILLKFVFLPSVIYYVIHFVSFRFGVNQRELAIRSGVAFRRDRRIAFERIQDVDIEQSFLSRLVGMASLKITTAGAEADEATLKYLSYRDAEDLRRILVKAEKPKSDGASLQNEFEADCLCDLSVRDLAWGALTSNLVAALFAMLGAFAYVDYFSYWGIESFEEAAEKHTREFFSRYPLNDFITRGVEYVLFSGSAIKAFLLALMGALFSMLAFVVKYYGFRLELLGRVATRSYGLLTRRRASLSQDRIQALKLEEGLLRRWFGLVAIRVDTAGDRKELDETKKKDLLVPVIKRADSVGVLQKLQPLLSSASPPLESLSKLAVMRRTRLGTLPVLVAAVLTWFASPWAALVWLPGLPLIYFFNLKWYHHSGYWCGEHHVIWRHGWLNRSTLFLPIRNIQNVSLSRSPFDRRLRLATLVIDTAGQSNTGGGAVIPHLPIREARALQVQLAEQVAQARFGW